MTNERIVSAAVHLGGIISLPRPARHGDIIASMDNIMQCRGVHGVDRKQIC